MNKSNYLKFLFKVKVGPTISKINSPFILMLQCQIMQAATVVNEPMLVIYSCNRIYS